jgi:hypothetical protein
MVVPGDQSWLARYGGDLVWAFIVAGLVLAAFVVPHLRLGMVNPLIDSPAAQYKALAQTAPLLGTWLPHVGWGTPLAVILAVAVVVWGPSLAARLPWRRLIMGSWLASAGWAMSLSLVDGWHRGFVGRLETRRDYLFEVPRTMFGLVHGFAARIPANQPHSWNIQVAGHPPGALLTFVGLARVGLPGGAWASTFCVAIGSSAAMAVLICIRAVDDETMARRAAPFVVLAPTAIWIAVSADAYFAGIAAWGLTLLALAATRTTRFPTAASVGAGVLLGFCCYLNYGLVLMAIPSLAVLVIARNHRPIIGAIGGAAAVVIVFTATGFWWFQGLSLLRHRYWAGVARDRPFAYWVWANLASLACAVGLAAATAQHRAFSWSAIRKRAGLNLLCIAFLVAVVAADLSGLSKAETERIWLPFAVWLVAAPALLPRRSHRVWLSVQGLGALVINSLILTAW